MGVPPIWQRSGKDLATKKNGKNTSHNLRSHPLLGPPKTCQPKLQNFFFLSHEPKHLPKLASPIKENNTQKIDTGTKPTYDGKKNTQKKFRSAARTGITLATS